MEKSPIQFENKPVIPRDRLAFFSGTIKKKDSYSDSHVVNAMPFDLSTVRGKGNDKQWDILVELAVKYLVEEGDLPSWAKAQDYERTGGCGYQSYNALEALASYYDRLPELSTEPIEVFNNAFDKIILPAGFREKIIETVNQLKDYKVIFEEWGLGEKVKRGKGVNLLFSGESGTGKTWCGEVIAEYLGTQSEVVSVATIESKWVGESEQNVSQIFSSLNGGNKVLILDEVDSFIASRKYTDGASGNYQSKLTNQFLIELERHNGIVVMTTNRPVKLDRALHRRIDLVLDFPFPEKEARKQIWKYMIPDKMPTENLDLNILSGARLSGGQIKNVIFAAARKAVTRNEKVTLQIVNEAITDELKESGNLLSGKDHS